MTTTTRTRCSLAALAALAIAVTSCSHGESAPARQAPGVRTHVFVDERRDRAIETIVFYPADPIAQPKTETHTYVFRVRCARGAPVATGGGRPLVVLSHGTGGTPYDQAWLASALVEEGYVVAAVRHPGDTFGDFSYLTALQVWNRPQDISFVIDTLLAHDEWRDVIDGTRIGVAGFSVGGYAALASVGAAYSLDEAMKNCAAWVGDPLCDAVRPLDRTPIDYSRSGVDYRDERIRASLSLAPAVAEAADLAAVKRITVPVHIVGIEHDHLAIMKTHAQRWADIIPTAEMTVLDEGNHYVLVQRCSAVGPAFADACRDPAGVDRLRVQRDVAELARSFFFEHVEAAR